MVQFAFIAPIVVLLMVGMIEITLIHMNLLAVDNVARVGARESLRPFSCDQAAITTRVRQAAGTLSADALRVTASSEAGELCALKAGDPIKVELTYAHQMMGMPAFRHLLPDDLSMASSFRMPHQ